jgi:hypothetical protein
MHPRLSAKARRARRHRGNVKNTQAFLAHLSTAGLGRERNHSTIVKGKSASSLNLFSLKCPALLDGLGLRRVYSGHRVSFRMAPARRLRVRRQSRCCAAAQRRNIPELQMEARINPVFRSISKASAFAKLLVWQLVSALVSRLSRVRPQTPSCARGPRKQQGTARTTPRPEATIRLWDAAAGVETGRPQGHSDRVTALCICRTVASPLAHTTTPSGSRTRRPGPRPPAWKPMLRSNALPRCLPAGSWQVTGPGACIGWTMRCIKRKVPLAGLSAR